MSEEKFTKGPWQYEDGNEIVYNQDGDVVCDTIGATTREHQDYNGHLIASAPEMYEMLDRVISNYQEAASVAEHEGYETKYSQDKIFVDALLAKARGEL
ncbi:hypothetical protein [Shewanella chilikensis]|uniref:hypothetical protein n=1 Tax=Shewanella chilikensis TaxID=558541 RepID=UPI003A9723E0